MTKPNPGVHLRKTGDGPLTCLHCQKEATYEQIADHRECSGRSRMTQKNPDSGLPDEKPTPDGVTCVRDGAKICPDDNSCCVLDEANKHVSALGPRADDLAVALKASQEHAINRHFHKWKVMGRMGVMREPVLMCQQEGCNLVFQPIESKILAKVFFFGKEEETNVG